MELAQPLSHCCSHAGLGGGAAGQAASVLSSLGPQPLTVPNKKDGRRQLPHLPAGTWESRLLGAVLPVSRDGMKCLDLPQG